MKYFRIYHFVKMEFSNINKLFDKHVLKWPRYYYYGSGQYNLKALGLGQQRTRRIGQSEATQLGSIYTIRNGWWVDRKNTFSTIRNG
jgi:hypothetical protein